MARAALVLAFALVAPLQAQTARRAVGEIPREKALVLGGAGAMLPESGRLGPFADLDGDGDPDLLADARNHLNDGFGVFRASRPVDIADEARLAFFRADADVHLDLLTRTHLYRGDASLGLADASAGLPAGFVADAVALGDLDGDLDVDIVALERRPWPDPARIQVLVNDGSGAFTDRGAPLPAPPSFARALAAGDLDGDLDLDLVVGGVGGGAVWLNDGSGVFTADAGALPPLSLGTRALALIRADADPDLDLVLAGDATGTGSRVVVLANDGGGAFTAGTPVDFTGYADAILPCDVEGDGDLDLVVPCAQQSYGFDPFLIAVPGSAFLLVNDGAGGFGAAAPLAGARGAPTGGFAGDLDGDGDADVVLADETFGHRVYLGAGGALVPVAPASVHAAAIEERHQRTVALGDLDGDGLADAFSPAAVHLNGPPGVFTRLAAPLPPLGTACYWDPFLLDYAGHAVLGDVDGDGDRDAYFVGRGMGDCSGPYLQSNRLWINDGTARFTDETLARLPLGGSEVTGNPTQVALLELDGDGDLDAACLRSEDYDGSGYSSCYVNGGTGVFTRKEDLGLRAYAGGFGDLDGDGDADFLEGAYYYYGTNRVYRNDGTAHFVLAPSALPAHALPLDANAVVLGDVDGDGDLDAYVSAAAPQATSFVYLNDGTASFTDQPWRLPTSLTGRPIGSAFVDADLDGDADLVTPSGLFVNDGAGAFSAAPERVRGFAGDRMALGDLDLDGDPDVVLVDETRTVVVAGLARHLESLGPARVGKRQTLLVHGTPRTPFVLLESLGAARIPLGATGWLLVDPARVFATTSGYLDGRGEAPVRRTVPANPALVGQTTYLQAFVGLPARSTALVVSTIGAQ